MAAQKPDSTGSDGITTRVPDSLPADWTEALAGAFADPSMAALKAFLQARRKAHATIYPPTAQWFRALEATPLSSVRVVILGQDPYHGPGQAEGLSFSVPPGVAPPPSLKNIFRELESDIGLARPTHGHLGHWAAQGVLLLNSVLTVEEGQAGSHRDRGWERFTDAVVASVAARDRPTAFVLWGSYAQRKAAFVAAPHRVIGSPHPSPLSAHQGFFGSRPFSVVNDFLAGIGDTVIDWSLPDDAA